MTTTFTSPANITREQFAAFRSDFRALAAQKKLTSTDILINNLIRGLPANRGFSEITNPVKLANGMYDWFGFEHAKSHFGFQVHWRKADLTARFKSLTAENFEELRKLA